MPPLIIPPTSNQRPPSVNAPSTGSLIRGFALRRPAGARWPRTWRRLKPLAIDWFCGRVFVKIHCWRTRNCSRGCGFSRERWQFRGRPTASAPDSSPADTERTTAAMMRREPGRAAAATTSAAIKARRNCRIASWNTPSIRWRGESLCYHNSGRPFGVQRANMMAQAQQQINRCHRRRALHRAIAGVSERWRAIAA